MSRNAICNAGSDFTVANYLRHIVRNETWREDAATAQIPTCSMLREGVWRAGSF